MKEHKKTVVLIIKLSILIIIAVVFPFLLEKILFVEKDETIIQVSPSDWFSFIASYLGALGAIVLGSIAIWQSKKYNDEAGVVNESFSKLQDEIRELTKSNKEVNASLLRLHKSIFEPRLSDAEMKFDCGRWTAFENIDYKNNRNPFAFSNWKNEYNLNDFDEHEEEYRYIAIKLYNDGEKYINTFGIDCLEIDELSEFDYWCNNTSDIPPHTYVWMTVAIADEKFVIVENELKSGKEVVIRSTFENTLGDKYISRCRISYEKSEEHDGAYIKGIDIQKRCADDTSIF